jgi:hypothetical protein
MKIYLGQMKKYIPLYEEYINENKVADLSQFTESIIKMFKTYIEDKNEKDLVKNLKKIEEKIIKISKPKKNAEVWFKFFKGDTTSTTVLDIEKDLDSSKTPAKYQEYLVEKFKIAIEKPSEFQIYYK